MKVLVIFCVLLYTSVSRCQYAPSIEACYASDRACLARSAQRALPAVAGGVPALGMQPLDPLRMPLVDASRSGLTMRFTNTVVKGLRNCRVADIGRRTRTETFITLKCPVELIGDYSMRGKLLIMPIEGQGRYKIKLREIQVEVVMHVGERAAGGNRYWVVRSWRHHAEATQPVQYQFQNLFNGNRQLSNTVLNFANQHWRQIFDEVAPPIVKAIISRVVDEVSKLFNSVPISQLAKE